MNRRELLKFFGAGTVIAPLAEPSVVGRLVEPPKVELFTPEVVPAKKFSLKAVRSVSVRLTLADGSVHSLESGFMPTSGGDLETGWSSEVTVIVNQATGSPAQSRGYGKIWAMCDCR